MRIKTLNRSESQIEYNNWVQNSSRLPDIENDYIKIRKDIQSFNKQVREESLNKKTKKDYYVDVHLGILLYDYLERQPGFNMRAAANDDFWRYMSIKVVPDVVEERWGKNNGSHYWERGSRIWLRCIWWYVHLSWQGDIASTARVLDSPCFTTDSILNLEERTGRKGTFIEVYRYIMYYYSRVPEHIVQKFNKAHQDDLFRVIMKLNTAKVMVINPSLYLGGEKEYVKSLFSDAGVRV